MPEPKFEIEVIVDSLSTIASILHNRLQCMECNQCEPCGEEFMHALEHISDAGKREVDQAP